MEKEAGLPEEGEAVVAALEGSDLEAASVVPRFLFFHLGKVIPLHVGNSLQVCVSVYEHCGSQSAALVFILERADTR